MEVRKTESKTINWTLELHYFPYSQSPITISFFTVDKRQQGKKKKWSAKGGKEQFKGGERGEKSKRQHGSEEERQKASMKASL